MAGPPPGELSLQDRAQGTGGLAACWPPVCARVTLPAAAPRPREQRNVLASLVCNRPFPPSGRPEPPAFSVEVHGPCRHLRIVLLVSREPGEEPRNVTWVLGR